MKLSSRRSRSSASAMFQSVLVVSSLASTANGFCSPQMRNHGRIQHETPSAIGSYTRIKPNTWGTKCFSSVSSVLEEAKQRRKEKSSLDKLQTKSVGGGFDPFNFASQGISLQKASLKKVEQTVEKQNPLKALLGDSSESLRARGLVLAAAALYGTNFTLVKILNEHLPVGASTSLRFVLAAISLIPFFFTKTEIEGEEPSSFQNRLPVVLAGMEVGFYNSIGYIAQAFGLETTDASKSAFICSLAVVVVPILDALAGKKKSVAASSIVGILFAVIGVGLLELGGEEGGLGALLHMSTGDLCTFAQPLLFGLGFFRMEDAMHKFPTEAKRLTAAQLLMVAIVSVFNCWVLSPVILDWFPNASISMPPSFVDVTGWLSDPTILGALIWTGIVTTAFTIYMETLALQTISAAEATLFFSTEPLWGAGFASVVAGEHLGPAAMAGAGLILSGCSISTLGGGGREEEEETPVEAKEISDRRSVLAQSDVGASALYFKAFIELKKSLESSFQGGSDVSDVASPNAIKTAVMWFESWRQMRYLSDTLDP